MNVGTMKTTASRAASLADDSQYPTSHATLRMRAYLSLLALDTLCVCLSFALASWIYKPGVSQDHWLVVVSVLVPIYIATALNSGAYSSEVIAKPNLGMLRAMRAMILAAGIIVLVAFYLKTSADFSRGMIAIGSTLSLVSLMLVRWRYLRRVHALTGGNPYSVALINDGMHTLDFSKFTYVIHAGIDIEPKQDCPVMFDRLALALKDADRVVIACPPERRLPWVHMLKGANIRSEMIAPELESLTPLALDRYAGTPTLIVTDGPLGKVDRVLKRGFDIVASGGALISLMPFMMLVALLIKLDSKGPVLFVQTRIGQGNRMFRMFKFRSMRVEETDGAGNRSANRDDDRVTPVGKLIRKTSIDELPQLLNVLRGDMSIVGPRPHALGSRAEDRLFWEVDARYWHRHAAKPGLTGLAQVRGFRGATERISDLTNRLQADLEYLHDWSLWRDLVIIAQTFRVLIHRNAF